MNSSEKSLTEAQEKISEIIQILCYCKEEQAILNNNFKRAQDGIKRSFEHHRDTLSYREKWLNSHSESIFLLKKKELTQKSNELENLHQVLSECLKMSSSMSLPELNSMVSEVIKKVNNVAGSLYENGSICFEADDDEFEDLIMQFGVVDSKPCTREPLNDKSEDGFDMLSDDDIYIFTGPMEQQLQSFQMQQVSEELSISENESTNLDAYGINQKTESIENSILSKEIDWETVNNESIKSVTSAKVKEKNDNDYFVNVWLKTCKDSSQSGLSISKSKAEVSPQNLLQESSLLPECSINSQISNLNAAGAYCNYKTPQIKETKQQQNEFNTLGDDWLLKDSFSSDLSENKSIIPKSSSFPIDANLIFKTNWIDNCSFIQDSHYTHYLHKDKFPRENVQKFPKENVQKLYKKEEQFENHKKKKFDIVSPINDIQQRSNEYYLLNHQTLQQTSSFHKWHADNRDFYRNKVLTVFSSSSSQFNPTTSGVQSVGLRNQDENKFYGHGSKNQYKQYSLDPQKWFLNAFPNLYAVKHNVLSHIDEIQKHSDNFYLKGFKKKNLTDHWLKKSTF